MRSDGLPWTSVETEVIDKTIAGIMEAHPDYAPMQLRETLREWVERCIETCGEQRGVARARGVGQESVREEAEDSRGPEQTPSYRRPDGGRYRRVAPPGGARARHRGARPTRLTTCDDETLLEVPPPLNDRDTGSANGDRSTCMMHRSTGTHSPSMRLETGV